MNKTTRSLVPAPPTPEPIAPAVIDDGFIKSRILTIRGAQVMLDRDLAELFGVATRRLNEQVKRNIRRFPDSFMFRLTKEELEDWRSQIATSKESGHSLANHLSASCEDWKSQTATSRPERGADGRLKSQNATSSWGGVRKPSNAFTEHGVIMLASVLKSDVAIEASIQIVNAFVAMRRALSSIAPLMDRIVETERLQLSEKTARLADQARNEARFDTIFKAMDGGDFPSQKIFYDGQLWDARAFVDRLVKRAKKSLLLVDNWATVETLDMLAAKQKGVAVTVVTSEHRDRKGNPRPKNLPADIARFNAQYPTLSVRFRENFHDRFLVIDDRELYLIGASLKDLGRKCFGFTRMDPSEIAGLKARM